VRNHVKFRDNRLTVVEIGDFLFFFQLAAARNLEFVVRAFGPPTMSTAKFGWNRQFSIEDIRVSMLCEFGLKTAIYAFLISFKGN